MVPGKMENIKVIIVSQNIRTSGKIKQGNDKYTEFIIPDQSMYYGLYSVY